ncbi:hypothetical protein PCL_08203 [Purpureocillium lilacinum]|uniref:Uncharacterized protein n=1 Tax=Purpureocillium lilacinum TaxID=33203 RepID=A0A2U3EK63_PURLI|nr:hypothetical protein PCL_08203 [Purpureocillium lilacinum]
MQLPTTARRRRLIHAVTHPRAIRRRCATPVPQQTNPIRSAGCEWMTRWLAATAQAFQVPAMQEPPQLRLAGADGGARAFHPPWTLCAHATHAPLFAPKPARHHLMARRDERSGEPCLLRHRHEPSPASDLGKDASLLRVASRPPSLSTEPGAQSPTVRLREPNGPAYTEGGRALNVRVRRCRPVAGAPVPGCSLAAGSVLGMPREPQRHAPA